MPLEESGSREAIGHNIKTEEEHGKPKKQAIAIALDTARKAGADIPKPHVEAHSEKPASGSVHTPRTGVGRVTKGSERIAQRTLHSKPVDGKMVRQDRPDHGETARG